MKLVYVLFRYFYLKIFVFQESLSSLNIPIIGSMSSETVKDNAQQKHLLDSCYFVIIVSPSQLSFYLNHFGFKFFINRQKRLGHVLLLWFCSRLTKD